ncbi:hypothetical protein P8452_58265 [Trifolium repens]|nr:hypothetical protein P8452_58265 [Trifolium repens]
MKRAAEFRTAGSLVCQEIELQIDVIGGCDKHTLKLPSELGYGSSVACCGEVEFSNGAIEDTKIELIKYNTFTIFLYFCSYFDALKFCFCVDGFI